MSELTQETIAEKGSPGPFLRLQVPVELPERFKVVSGISEEVDEVRRRQGRYTKESRKVNYLLDAFLALRILGRTLIHTDMGELLAKTKKFIQISDDMGTLRWETGTPLISDMDHEAASLYLQNAKYMPGLRVFTLTNMTGEFDLMDYMDKFSAIGHDIRTPLTAIYGYLQLSGRKGEPIDPKTEAVIKANIKMLNQTMEEQENSLKEIYIPEQIPVKELKARLEETLREKLSSNLMEHTDRNVSVDINFDALSMITLGSIGAIREAVKNMAENLLGTYNGIYEGARVLENPNRVLKVSFNVVNSKTGEQELHITFDDEGSGFKTDSPMAIDHEYRAGYSGRKIIKKGERHGIGMAAHTRRLRKYGISLVPENRIVNGQIVGARHTIILPIIGEPK